MRRHKHGAGGDAQADFNGYSGLAVRRDVHIEVVDRKRFAYLEILLEFDLSGFKDALHFVNYRAHMNVVAALEKVDITDGLTSFGESLNVSAQRGSV